MSTAGDGAPDARAGERHGRRRSPARSSLRRRLTLAYLGLAIVPLVVVAGLVGQRSVAELNEQSRVLQQTVAVRVAQEVAALIDGRIEKLRAFVLGSGLARRDRISQRVLLDKLLANDRLFQDIALVNDAGRELMRLSRTEVFLPERSDATSYGPEMTLPLGRREVFLGHVRFDDDVREPLATLSLPVLDQRSGEPVLALVANLRLARIWESLGTMELPEGVDVFVLGPDGRVLAHRNPATVLAGTRLDAPDEAGLLRLDGRDYLAVEGSVERAGQLLRVLAIRARSTAYAPAARSLSITAIVTLVAALVAGGLVVASVRYVVEPIEGLAGAARRAGSGDLDFEPVGGGPAELQGLARDFARMLRDMRAARRAARDAQLRALRQEKLAALGQMAGELGHELRNPLGAIENSAAVLEARVPAEDERARRSVARIASQVQRISRLTSDLLAFARTRDCEKTDVTLEHLIDETLDNCPPPAGITVHRPPSGAETGVHVDPQQIGQVLGNLVTNAYQAMPEGGELSVDVESDDGQVRCAVRDSGVGIAPDALERVFEPLFTTRQEGVGLGLAICRNLSELNGGRLRARSRVGVGTTFELELPPTSGAAAPDAVSPAPGAP